jgi:hypothetical protein
MSRINIELTIDGDAEDAYRSIDHLLDHNVIQEAIDGVKIEGSRPVRVTCAIAVQVTIPRALLKTPEVSNDLPPASGEIAGRRFLDPKLVDLKHNGLRSASSHSTDADCDAAGTVVDGECTGCGVYGDPGDPCQECGGVRYHADSCPTIDRGHA